MFFFSRLMNTAATCGRSLATPVSFSTIEAMVTSSAGDLITASMAGSRPAQISSTFFFISACIFSSTEARVSPGKKS